MTPLQLKCLRESLNISQSQLAELVSVTSRSVRHWESGQRAIPDRVYDVLNDIDFSIDLRIDDYIDALTEETNYFHTEDVITISTYISDEDYRKNEDWPSVPFASCHRAYAVRLAKSIDLLGGRACIDGMFFN